VSPPEFDAKFTWEALRERPFDEAVVLPHGDDDARVDQDLALAGYTRKAGRSIDTLGWRGVSAPEIVERSLRLAVQCRPSCTGQSRDGLQCLHLQDVVRGAQVIDVSPATSVDAALAA
jgi:hypothetical protein